MRFLEYYIDEEEGLICGFIERNVGMFSFYNPKMKFGLRRAKKQMINECKVYMDGNDEICLLKVDHHV